MTAQHFYVVHVVITARLHRSAPVHHTVGFGVDRSRGHGRRCSENTLIVALIGLRVEAPVKPIGVGSILASSSERAAQCNDLLNPVGLRAGDLSGIDAA